MSFADGIKRFFSSEGDFAQDNYGSDSYPPMGGASTYDPPVGGASTYEHPISNWNGSGAEYDNGANNASSNNSAYNNYSFQKKNTAKNNTNNTAYQQTETSYAAPRQVIQIAYPKNFQDCVPDIADRIMRNETVVFGINCCKNAEERKKILTFLGGVVYSKNGIYSRLQGNMFIAAPKGIELSGDVKDLIKDQGLNLDEVTALSD